MSLNRLFAAIALMGAGGLVGCASTASIREHFHTSDRDLPFDKRLRMEARAPIILLGHVVSVGEIGAPRQSSADHRIGIQLTRIKVDVEVVLKGDVNSDSADVYYFAYSPSASRMDFRAPRYLPAVGQHRIFFLKPTDTGYRLVGDILDYTLRVSSGRHSRGLCDGMTPGCCIAQILLVPQRNMDVDQFVADLVVSAYAAEVLCSREAAQNLLQRLVAHPDDRVSDRARDVIAGTQLPGK